MSEGGEIIIKIAKRLTGEQLDSSDPSSLNKAKVILRQRHERLFQNMPEVSDMELYEDDEETIKTIKTNASSSLKEEAWEFAIAIGNILQQYASLQTDLNKSRAKKNNLYQKMSCGFHRDFAGLILEKYPANDYLKKESSGIFKTANEALEEGKIVKATAYYRRLIHNFAFINGFGMKDDARQNLLNVVDPYAIVSPDLLSE